VGDKDKLKVKVKIKATGKKAEAIAKGLKGVKF